MWWGGDGGGDVLQEPDLDFYKTQASELKVKGNALDTSFYEGLQSLVV